MNVQIEKSKGSQARLTVVIDAGQFDDACNRIYNSRKDTFNIPGIRKGKASREMVERTYGKTVFHDAAAELCIRETFYQACDQAGIAAIKNSGLTYNVNSDKSLTYIAELVIEPEVKLGNYKGIHVSTAPLAVTDSLIDSTIDMELKRKGKWEPSADRAVEEGDKITFDFAGSVDGVKFDGGSAENYDLIIGSKAFIPGFEEQLIGVRSGQHRDVTVTFPENYPAGNLAGKEAVFACDIKCIETYSLPELSDDFVKENYGFSTLVEYRQSVKENLEKSLKERAKNDQVTEAVKIISDSSTVDIPDEMLAEETERKIAEFENNLRRSGHTLEDYLEYSRENREQLAEKMKESVIDEIKGQLILGAIAKAENIKVSDEDVDRTITEIAGSMRTPLEAAMQYFKKPENLRDIVKDIIKNKAVDIIYDNLVTENN